MEPLSNSLLQIDKFESIKILRQLSASSRALAELKGMARLIPNQELLINTLGLQEAKDSSEIENIITTHDTLYREEYNNIEESNPETKEILRYRQALRVGFENVKSTNLITNQHLLQIHEHLERNNAGFRRLPGTSLKNNFGEVVYEPPQLPSEIIDLMSELERFINQSEFIKIDPLIKMAIIHHQFESIHPFYDGNGRTGRILNVLYLVKEGLLDIPVLYLSNYIVRHKAQYYRLLQEVRNTNDWEEWILYMLKAVEETSVGTMKKIKSIQDAIAICKQLIKTNHSFYSHELINHLFTHPYTKTEFLVRDLKISRITASKYLSKLSQDGLLEVKKIGKSHFFINKSLMEILME